MRLSVFGYAFELDETLVDVTPAELRRAVATYERGDSREFVCAVAYPEGFTGAVMRAIAEIPYGETRTYGELADELDTSAVAVGGACGRNPLPLVVPCHRVVGASSLGGFSAHGGVAAKRRLLAHERGGPVQQTLD
ncbi:methylated-DNA--[protein]-cysteine S-methyltransferase [Salinigranum halophilum]|uniref:methylated-DNA--[protein]-cysteine S-methyltransferase n=1 Tax=Salinigranum halophilum TaxID=2565931 RepID=UPI0010A8CDA0|nr:methylated-DNA--[protein]-cysteine S-methyltransferase [Salinigranum halophilum]